MSKRSNLGRGLFYTRDSQGRSDLASPQYVAWARAEAAKLGVTFGGTPEAIEAMIARGVAAEGDVFVDYGVSGNVLDRPGFDAFRRKAIGDFTVSHVFIPRRDRIARPDRAIDGVLIESELREAGLTIVFMDRIVPPVPAGRRADLGDALSAYIDYDNSGRFRRDLAEKLIHAKIKLAGLGFSIGGEPPYGFRRWLFGPDGVPKRELAQGEVVKMAGHHVAWLPTAERELEVVRRILNLIGTVAAARIARVLNDEGIPSPKAGRVRKVGRIRVPNSGLWTQTTVRNIATHPLLIAICEYGRRASGDQLRLTPEGPRILDDGDFRSDGKPKAVVNPAEKRITTPARFEPIIRVEKRTAIEQILEERGRHLKGKARTRRNSPNPLGGRIYDLSCGWLMYRHARRGRWGYQCGLYQNSQAACCAHNVVEGEPATRFVVSCVRQRVLAPRAMAKLKARLLELAAAEGAVDAVGSRRAALERELAAAVRNVALVSRNMALSKTAEEREATAVVFAQVKAEEARLQRLVRELGAIPATVEPSREVEAALAGLDRLHELAGDADHAAASELFRRLDAKLYLRFRAEPRGGRTVNVPSGGALTFGPTPPPGPLYDGPTDRAILRARLAEGSPVTAIPGGVPPGGTDPGREVNWSANVQRGTSRCSGPRTAAAPIVLSSLTRRCGSAELGR